MVLSWIIFIGIAILSFIVQSSLKSKFDKYSKVPLYNGMTGRKVFTRRVVWLQPLLQPMNVVMRYNTHVHTLLCRCVLLWYQ